MYGVMKHLRVRPPASDEPLSFTREAPRVRRRPSRPGGARTYIALVVAGLVMVALAASGMRGDSRAGVPSTGGRALDIPAIEHVPYFLQKDRSWASGRLGTGGSTMGGEGCTVCCVAMGVSALGRPMNPGEVRAALERTGGFTDSGLLVWSAVGRITDGAVRVEIPRLSHAVIDTELSEGRPVLAHIMLGETYPHWVLIVGKDGQEYLVMDPLNPMRIVARMSDIAPAIRSIRVLRRG